MHTSDLAATCLVGMATAMAVLAGTVAVSTLPALPDAHGFAGCFAGVSGNHLLVVGGANFPDGVMPWDGGKKVWHATVFALDLAAPAVGWTKLGALPQAVGYGVSIQTSEGLLLIGGGDATAHSAATRLLKWAATGPVVSDWARLPVALANSCGASCGQRVHLVGGTTGPDAVLASKRHFILDLAQREQGWVEAAPLPGDGVMLATALAQGEDFYVAGGCSLHADAAGKPARTYLKQCWKFANGTWTQCPDLPRAAVGAASPGWAVAGKLVLIGGDDGTQVGGDPRTHHGFCRDLLAYDPVAEQWSRLAALETELPVTLPAVAVAGSYILVSGEIRPGIRTPAVVKLTLPAP